ncbi:MAG: SsrA-binding protein SmpB [Saprospiraceae bacterium]|nr:SsrA-binding protein SmpB [Saprospiraceae bacterium]
MEILNRKAKFEYHFVQKFEAGMALVGTEVKALRAGEASLGEAWCHFEGDELFLKNMHIGHYRNGPPTQHDHRRTRKLLLKAAELRKLKRKAEEKGMTIVPLRIYFSDNGYAKCEIALAQGKRSYDKRQTIKERDVQRDLARLKKL